MPRWHRVSLGMIAVLLVWGVTWAQTGKPERERIQEVVQGVQQLLETGKAIETIREILYTQSGTAPSAEQVVGILNWLVEAMYRAGAYAQGLELAKQTQAYAEAQLGVAHPETLRSLNNLASLYQAQGRYGEAEPLFQQALATSERVLGAEHPETLRVQLNYAVLLVNRAQSQRSLHQLKLLEPRLLAFAGVQLHTTLQEQVRRDFLLSHSTFQDVVFTLAVQQKGVPELRTFAAKVLLRWKQVQRDEDAYLAGLLRTSNEAVVTRLGQEIKELRRDVSHLTNRPQANPEILRAKHRALDAKEVELARHSPRYQRLLVMRELQLNDVRTHLSQDSALLELRVYHPVDFKTGKRGERHWLALLLPAAPGGEPDLVLQDLGPLAESEKRWQALRQHDTREAAGQLYQYLFGPLDAPLHHFKTLYIAPGQFCASGRPDPPGQTRLEFLTDKNPARREPRVWAPYVLVDTRAGR